MGSFRQKLSERIARIADRIAPTDDTKAFAPGPIVGSIFAEAESGAKLSTLSVTKYDYDDGAKAMTYNTWVRACTERIANTIAAVPLRIYPESESLDENAKPLLNHPLAQLLRKPSRLHSQRQYMRHIAARYVLDGQSICYLDNKTNGASPFTGNLAEIRPMFSAYVEPVVDPVNLIRAYRYKHPQMPGGWRDFPAGFWMHVRNFNPEDDFVGFPLARTAEAPIMADYYADQTNIAMFKNGVRPGGFIETKERLTDEAKDTTIKRILKIFGGPSKAWSIGVLDKESKFVPFEMNPRDGEWINIGKSNRERICSLTQVPPVLVGIFEYANYANSEQQIEIFFEFTIKPMLLDLADAHQTQVLWPWYDGDRKLVVRPDLSAMKQAKEDALKEAQAREVDIRSGFRLRSELRQEAGLTPYDGDDEPGLPSGGALFLADDIASRGGRITTLKARSDITREELWKARDRDTITIERDVERTMKRFFYEQGGRVNDALLSQFGRDVLLKSPDFSADAFYATFDAAAEDKALAEDLLPVELKHINDIGRAVLNDMLRRAKADIVWNVKDPRIQSYLAKKQINIKAINSVTRDRVRRVLLQQSAENATVGDLSRALTEKFTQFSKVRSIVIARTESVGAQSAASLAGFSQSNVVKGKEWLTARDDSVRELHVAMDGEGADGSVALDAKFSNGLMHPCDPAGAPEQVIQCRCLMLPVLNVKA